MKYFFNKVKLRGKQCAANVSLLFDSRSNKIYFFRSDQEHTHSASATAIFRFTEAEEEFIKELVDAGFKPKQIKYNLVKKNMQIPSDTRLNSILAKMRIQKYGDKLHIGSLEKPFSENMSVPENDTDPFILNYETDIRNKKDVKFRFIVSRYE